MQLHVSHACCFDMDRDFPPTTLLFAPPILAAVRRYSNVVIEKRVKSFLDYLICQLEKEVC